VERVEEVLGLEEARDPVQRLVVHEDGAEEGLLGLQVVRSFAVVAALREGVLVRRANQCGHAEEYPIAEARIGGGPVNIGEIVPNSQILDGR